MTRTSSALIMRVLWFSDREWGVDMILPKVSLVLLMFMKRFLAPFFVYMFICLCLYLFVSVDVFYLFVFVFCTMFF